MDPHQKPERVGVASVESNDRRQPVQPTRNRGAVKLRKRVAGCPCCGNSHFRRSHLRLTDLTKILTLRYPVRCIRCGQRQFTNLYIAMTSHPTNYHD